MLPRRHSLGNMRTPEPVSNGEDRVIGPPRRPRRRLARSLAPLAREARAISISADEFSTFNRCLDDAIAQAVTEYERQRDRTIGGPGDSTNSTDTGSALTSRVSGLRDGSHRSPLLTVCWPNVVRPRNRKQRRPYQPSARRHGRQIRFSCWRVCGKARGSMKKLSVRRGRRRIALSQSAAAEGPWVSPSVGDGRPQLGAISTDRQPLQPIA